MKNNIKFVFAVAIAISLVLGCSFIKDLKEKIKEEDKEVKNTDDKEKMNNSAANLEFYNHYIEASNKLSGSVDNVHKYYLQTIPDPSKVTKNSLIIIAIADTYLGFLERDLKEQQRSLDDGGDLSKLSADEEMQTTIETDFRELMKQIDNYNKVADKVITYYNGNDFKDDLSKAVPYDEEIRNAYKNYENALNRLLDDLKKFKPAREERNPDDYKDPDEKSVVILGNAYDRILDAAEEYSTEFKKSPDKPNLDELRKLHDNVRNVYAQATTDVKAAPFTDKSKYMKYTYEDYFSQTIENFLKSSNDYMKIMQKGNYKEWEFNNAYDAVIRNYNNIITSYNSAINTMNSFQVY